MSILDTNKIDIIGTKAGSKEVRLVITDHLSWDDPETHCQLIQDKINTYIAFVESGQLYRTTSPAIPTAPEITIVLAVKERPCDVGMMYLDKFREALQQIDIALVVENR